MNNDMSSRLITVGESHIDPEKHVLLNPMDTYDQDVEFVNSKPKVVSETPEVFDDKEIKSRIAEIEERVYALYGLRDQTERKNFLKENQNAIFPFMQAINELDGNLTLEE